MATKLKVNYEFVGDSTTPVTRTNSIKHGDKMLNKVIDDMSTYVTPEMFGAVGDGVTDDTKAIQDAIDYAHNHNIKKVVFSDKTYCTNIIVYSDIELSGSGKSVLKSVSGSNKDVIKSVDFDEMTGTTGAIPTNKGIRFFKINHMIIDGNRENNTSGYGIKIFGRNLLFTEVLVKNCKSGGMYTEFGTHNAPAFTDESFYGDLLESVFERIKIYNCDGNGWDYFGPHDSHIKYLICVRINGWAFRCVSGGINLENINTWFVENGCYFGSGGFRLLNCQIDGGGYNGEGSTTETGKGIEIADVCGEGCIKNTTLGGWNKGVVVGGMLHMLDYNVRGSVIGTEIRGGNNIISAIVHNCTNAFELTENASNNVNSYVKTCTNLFKDSVTPVIQGNASWNVVSDNPNHNYTQLSTDVIHSVGWSPIMPKSNETILTENSAPQLLKRGGVLLQSATKKSDELATMTAADYNYILQLLEWSGVVKIENN